MDRNESTPAADGVEARRGIASAVAAAARDRKTATTQTSGPQDGTARTSLPRKSNVQHMKSCGHSDTLPGYDPDAVWVSLESEQSFSDFTTVKATEASKHDRSSYTRIVCMSDTHGKHREVGVPRGDVLIHGGDFTKAGETHSVEDLSLFFGELPFDQIVCIAGNHDLTFQTDHYERVWDRFSGRREQPFDAEATQRSLTNCTYLKDTSCLIRGGIEVYGSPWQPEFFDWAFNLPRGEPLRKVWSNIPDTTDVLVTHGPPLGRGDLCIHGGRAGCLDLLTEVQTRVKPRLHIFGHIHEGYGVTSDGTTLFVNASNLAANYSPINPCIVIDMPHDRSLPPVLVEPTCTFTRDEFVEWLGTKHYNALVPHFEKDSVRKIPEGSSLLAANAYDRLSGKLSLDTFHDKEARKELRLALSTLHAESYSQN